MQKNASPQHRDSNGRLAAPTVAAAREDQSSPRYLMQIRDSVTEVWGERSPFQEEWPERVDQLYVQELDHWVQSCCMLCSNGCALDIGVKEGRIVGVRGRGVDRINKGRLGPKGLHGWEANHSADRLTRPLIRKHGKLTPVSWNEAMRLLARRSLQVQAEYTSDAFALYNTGQLFLEEYYIQASDYRARPYQHMICYPCFLMA